MVKNFTLARPYVKAIFALALQQNKLQEWEDLLNFLSRMAKQGIAKNIWQNPKMSYAQKIEILNSFFKNPEAPMQKEVNNFLRLLVGKRKLFILPQIAILFKEYRNEYEKIMPAKVASAFALDENQLQRIEDLLEKKFNNKIVLDSSIDTELIGGAVVYIKDYVIDGTIKGQLLRLSEYLL